MIKKVAAPQTVKIIFKDFNYHWYFQNLNNTFFLQLKPCSSDCLYKQNKNTHWSSSQSFGVSFTTVAYAQNGVWKRLMPLPTQTLWFLRKKKKKSWRENVRTGTLTLILVYKHFGNWRRRWWGDELKPDSFHIFNFTYIRLIEPHKDKHTSLQCYSMCSCAYNEQLLFHKH